MNIFLICMQIRSKKVTLNSSKSIYLIQIKFRYHFQNQLYKFSNTFQPSNAFWHSFSGHLNLFPPADTFWRNWSSWHLKKLWGPKVKLLMISNCSFGHNIFNFIQQLSYLWWRIFRFLSLCFQSRLLQISCMWERVIHKHLVFLA